MASLQPRTRQKPQKTTRSAGGLVLHRGLVLVVRQGRSWSLPKGHLEPGETALQAARREIFEESGIQTLTLVRPLGSYTRYRIGLDGKDDKTQKKTLTFFLFTTRQSRLRPRDPHNPEALWLSPAAAIARLTHKKDKAFLRKAARDIKNIY